MAKPLEPLIPARMLFRFEVPCLHFAGSWGLRGVELGPEYAVLGFGELEGYKPWGDFRIGYSAEGLFIWLRAEGKRRQPWCRATRAFDSDGLHLWIDTRNTQSIHRASRFCHRFVLLPFGAGRKLDEPVAELVTINRARENPKPAASGAIKIRSERRVDGYLLQAFIPAGVLTGYDPAEQPKLGFTYSLTDSEMGEQNFSLPGGLPFDEDPSLWGTLALQPA